ncbi:porin family protein [Algoriphagus sp. CAU 1675]|uniref:porin family protein n=1 Tax=Algoriphagus sp. CAU 1675 TaxID=3032597 RepID=UPI0023DCB089|nr:porin family protein [Algoriphagus sp. CAU 1675]MDF2157575.1 porin family protein [Algoriphagus sp. CAU 1675]
MKKALLLFALLAVSFAGYSQKFGIGPKVGISQTKLDFKNDDFSAGDTQSGYHIGLFARIEGTGFFVQPEFLFTQTSGTFSYNGPIMDGNSDFEASFNRLDIPVMMGMKFFKILRLQAGPIASVNINSKLEDVVGEVSDVDYNKATLGYQAGIGLDIGNMIIDAKYEGSLQNVTDRIRTFETDQRINQWILSVGFRIF